MNNPTKPIDTSNYTDIVRVKGLLKSEEDAIRNISVRKPPFDLCIEIGEHLSFKGTLGLFATAFIIYLFDQISYMCKHIDMEKVLEFYHNYLLDTPNNDPDIDRKISAVEGAISLQKEVYKKVPSTEFFLTLSLLKSINIDNKEEIDRCFNHLITKFYNSKEGNLDLCKYSNLDPIFKQWCENHNYHFTDGKCVFDHTEEQPKEDTTDKQIP